MVATAVVHVSGGAHAVTPIAGSFESLGSGKTLVAGTIPYHSLTSLSRVPKFLVTPLHTVHESRSTGDSTVLDLFFHGLAGWCVVCPRVVSGAGAGGWGKPSLDSAVWERREHGLTLI